MRSEFRLTGPRGDNPLGFLTALGALSTLGDAGHEALLSWEGVRPKLLANLHSPTNEVAITDEAHRGRLVAELFRALRRTPGENRNEAERAKKAMEEAKTAHKKKRDEIKKRKLDRQAARQARRLELDPLKRDVEEKSDAFRRLLATSAADPSVALGKNLTESNATLMAYVTEACEQCSPSDRRCVDLAAAYGIADPARPDERMLASPWALVSGSGHQDFLSSVQELMLRCKESHLRRALFGPWDPLDEKYSLRLDATDDRRYALMDQDPKATGNKPRTLWGANRLAFEALRFFPAVPDSGGMGVCGWRATGANWQDGCGVRWPLWEEPVGATVVQSLLGLRDLWLEDPASGARLRAVGVHTLMESRRIAVGDGANRKYNLTPATPVWVSTQDDRAWA